MSHLGYRTTRLGYQPRRQPEMRRADRSIPNGSVSACCCSPALLLVARRDPDGHRAARDRGARPHARHDRRADHDRRTRWPRGATQDRPVRPAQAGHAVARAVLPRAAGDAAAQLAVDAAEPLRRQGRLRLELRQLLDGVHRLRRTVPARLRLRRDRHRAHDPARLSARLRHRLPRRQVPRPPARIDHHPVLHVVPDPHDRLAEPPRRHRTDPEPARRVRPPAACSTPSASWTATRSSTPRPP